TAGVVPRIAISPVLGCKRCTWSAVKIFCGGPIFSTSLYGPEVVVFTTVFPVSGSVEASAPTVCLVVVWLGIAGAGRVAVAFVVGVPDRAAPALGAGVAVRMTAEVGDGLTARVGVAVGTTVAVWLGVALAVGVTVAGGAGARATRSSRDQRVMEGSMRPSGPIWKPPKVNS